MSDHLNPHASNTPLPSSRAYLDAAIRTLQHVRDTQAEALQTAGSWIADAIAAGGFAHFFGAGHSHMALEEAFPRNGGLIGMRPISELALANYTNVVGSAGILQMRFFQETEGLAERIWSYYTFKPTDVFVVFTNTGITRVAIEMAMLAKAAGHRVIGVVSAQHTEATGVSNTAGKKLTDVVDLVIDNGSPPGDASIDVPGLPWKMGPVSTIGAVAIVNALACEAAGRLIERGQPVLVLGSAYWEGEEKAAMRKAAEENWRRCIAEFNRRLKEQLRTDWETPAHVSGASGDQAGDGGDSSNG